MAHNEQDHASPVAVAEAPQAEDRPALMHWHALTQAQEAVTLHA
jgi:hypothetical protein